MRQGEAHRRPCGGLGFELQVRDHRAHGGLVDQGGAESRPVAGMPRGLGHRLPHSGGRADHAVQARAPDHVDDGPHAAAGLSDEPRKCAVKLDFA